MAEMKATGGSRDSYKKDSTPRGLNHRDKGSPAKKISTASLKKFDKQC